VEVARRIERISPLKIKSKRCLTDGPKDEEDQILLPKGHDVVQGKNGLPSVHKSIVEDMVGTIQYSRTKGKNIMCCLKEVLKDEEDQIYVLPEKWNTKPTVHELKRLVFLENKRN